MHVYHYSEDPHIPQFIPRSPRAHPEAEPLVYAIDADHSPLYYLPHDCPRVCYWLLQTTTQEDRERYYANVTASKVIVIESAWVPRLQSVTLYRYTFDSEHLTATGDHGVYVSRNTIVPLRVEPLGNLLEQLTQSDVELRICPSLVPIGQAIVKTTLHFSLIRMRNAQGWEGAKGTPVGHPL